MGTLEKVARLIIQVGNESPQTEIVTIYRHGGEIFFHVTGGIEDGPLCDEWNGFILDVVTMLERLNQQPKNPF